MSTWQDAEDEFYSHIVTEFVKGNCMAKDKYLIIRGTLDWAKLSGPARPHTGLAKYNKGPYWSVDVTPDAKSLKAIEAAGFADKLKDPSPKDKQRVGTGKFLALRVLENRSDGSKNSPPKLVNLQGETFTDGLLGNGTLADVKVKVKDYGPGSEMGVYLQAVRVLKHVPYEVEEFAPLSEDDEFFGATDEVAADTPSEASDPDLDDDVPF
jgi:hypothetical protein